MKAFAHSESNIMALVILLVILLDMSFNTNKMKYDNKLYFSILLSTAVIIILDIFMGTIEGKTRHLFREINIIITTLYFILNPIPYMTWSMYVDFYIHKSIRKSKKRIPLFAIPAILNAILAAFSLYNKGIFFISESNIYHRGHLFLLTIALYYTYFVGTYIHMIKNRKNIKKSEYYALLLFGVIPGVLGTIQTIDPSKSFLWFGVSISILLIYLNVQNSTINVDYLTDLYNRRHLDNYLNSSIRELDEREYLFIIMADIDYFKTINDTYGHVEGDRALKYTADLFTSTFRSDDFIARYAGDEFVIILKLDHKNCKEKIISRLRRKFDEFNDANITPYDINISLGYDIYDTKLEMDTQEFLKHVDQLMYEDKKISR